MQLLRERERTAETEDPYETKRIPVTGLTVYPELTEALPSIEEDFFRTPLTKEERKITIHFFPKTNSMNYIPPPLNGSASSGVNSRDTTNRLLLSPSYPGNPPPPGINTASDSEVTFSSMMRALLADIETTVTQAMLDNLHKGLDLPGRPTQLVKSDTKPLMDQ
ncbi:hypothetical protein AYI70_g185 [Smittium culicis]|uniref:Uncharacterized protein n=1 Tax=Smittium culicis TaxID=133412 RepID=A0A1R1YHP9_9FUNG|nr:hypothetical protein AYI70_g185 [Smittium culicis]